MKLMSLSGTTVPTAAMTLVKTALLSGVLMAFAPGVGLAEPVPKTGSAPYTTHFVFHPKSTVDIPGVGKATALEAVGPTENTAGGTMYDKMKAKCAAVKIDFGRQELDRRCLRTDRRRWRRDLLNLRHA